MNKQNTNLKILPSPKRNIPNAILFLSGQGTNATKILEDWQNNKVKYFHPIAIVTDRKISQAKNIAQKF